MLMALNSPLMSMANYTTHHLTQITKSMRQFSNGAMLVFMPGLKVQFGTLGQCDFLIRQITKTKRFVQLICMTRVVVVVMDIMVMITHPLNLLWHLIRNMIQLYSIITHAIRLLRHHQIQQHVFHPIQPEHHLKRLYSHPIRHQLHSSNPTRTPSQTPILTSNQTPTPSQSPILSSDPTRTPSQTPILTSNQTPTPSQSLHSSYPSDMPSVNSTPRPTRQQDGQVDDESTTEYSDSKSQDKDQIMSFEWNESVVIAVIFSMVLFVIVVVLVCVLYRIRHNQADAKKIVDVIKETFEEDDVNGDNTHGIQTQSGLAVKDDDDVIKPRNMHGEGEENTNAYDHEGDSPIAIVMETKGEHRQTVPPPLPPRVLHEDFANVAQSAPNVDPVCFVNAAHLDDEIVDPDEDNNGLMTTGGIGTVQ
eukprot:13548_1